MTAGVRVASGWPAGLNSRWLGKVKMSPLASRPSAVKSDFPPCTSPPVPKEVSMLPSALNRASAPKVSGARLVPDGLPVMFSPPTSIFPSGWIRTVWAPCTLAWTTGKVVVPGPPAPKPWSSVPLALNRTTANVLPVPLLAVASPAHTSLPSDWTARQGWTLGMPRLGRAAKPPLPNVVSLAPFGRNRASPEPGLPDPTETTMSPFDCSTAAAGNPWLVSTMPFLPKVGSRVPAVLAAAAVPTSASATRTVAAVPGAEDAAGGGGGGGGGRGGGACGHGGGQRNAEAGDDDFRVSHGLAPRRLTCSIY